jgi:uracil-DNA glycosylase
MFKSLSKDWQDLLKDSLDDKFYEKIKKELEFEYKNHKIFPSKKNIFRIFERLNPTDIKIIILGQDPYHGIGQANGYAFAVNDKIYVPFSLQNIWKEIERDYPNQKKDKTLEFWVNQGVFLLNSILTVRENSPSSHKNLGWEIWTDQVIKILSEKFENLVFLLWGNFAKEKYSLISKKNGHLILQTSHPSPFSFHKGFFGCNHFKLTNNFLDQKKKNTVVW